MRKKLKFLSNEENFYKRIRKIVPLRAGLRTLCVDRFKRRNIERRMNGVFTILALLGTAMNREEPMPAHEE
ncbi:hypothetical protein KIN20_010381 [Parelaphostrongylus tenuis]|uniref:Uncharacterized protein n=1 Tax=Parelaphostrongylus tenuis TaxID=148309 RepID=A0AAD5M9K1_PARTN|nr:hypothetical protein KIN20_010381 [Parelaphostrongylus tenuis]